MITRRTIKRVRRTQAKPTGTRVRCVTGRALLRHQYAQWAEANTELIDKRPSRRRSRVSLLISLVLHILVLAIMNIRLPEWYRPPLIPEPIVMAPIELVDVPRFHISSARKRMSAPTPQNRKPPNPTLNRPATQSRPAADRVKHIAQLTPLASQTLNTDAKLDLSDTLLSNHSRMEPLLEDSRGSPAGIVVHSPQAREVEVKRDSSQRTEEQSEAAENAPPASRGEQIGTALEGIAESIAGGTSSSPVDIVFLLDASGSMEDNIRAVGGQLRRMVDVFQEKKVNFTLGIITFKYLDRDTIVFPQTKDYAKYQHLLESHVIQRGGDERAYDAIVKSIKRVKFRSNAERRFVLVTDEATKGSYPITEVLRQCRGAGIKLDVIGVNRTLDKALAAKTGGLWFPIPGGG